MRFWSLFKRNIKETSRDALALGFLLAFPLVFMLLFGVAFGGDMSASYGIGIVDNDRSEVSQAFIDEALPATSVLHVSKYSDTDSALEALRLGNISSYVVIPEGFGEQVALLWQKASGDIVLYITYDESNLSVSSNIISIVNSVTRSYAGIEIPITINTNPINIESKITQMDFIAPGIIVFGLLIMIPTAGRIMLRDKESRFLHRMMTTPTRPWEFIASYSCSMTIIAIIQIILFILLGWLFGMDIIGNIWLAFAIFALTGICSIGIGMVVASLAKSENQGEPLSWLFSMPLAMLSGVWFTSDFLPSYIRTFADLFPYSHAVNASRAVITRGVGMEAISGDFWFLVIWSVVIFIIGTFLFQRSMRS
ncbi:MAG: ABC transporter permease [Dehalococcoidales bacterium]|nr:ABC transporter permease [Dehalococcoidales bacterium]